MSLPVFTWVLDNSEATLGARLVLLVLAEHAHDDGSESYPALDTIARRTRMSRKGVRDALRRLVDDGHVAEDGLGPRGQTKWRITFQSEGVKEVHPADGQGVKFLPEGGVVPARSGEATTPEPSLEPSLEPSEKDRARALVDDVWQHYQQTFPEGAAQRHLNSERRRLVQRAVAVRPVESCKLAITGLSKSDYHRENGFLDLKYALLGGGRSPSIEATIDRLAAQASNGSSSAGGSDTVGPATKRRRTDYDAVIIREDE